MNPSVTWTEAASIAATERHGPLTRRRLTRQKRTPLRAQESTSAASPSSN
jgi:hypothetical protein